MTAIQEIEPVINHLCPRVLVYTTNEIDEYIEKQTALPNLTSLLKPFQEKAVEKVQLRSSTFESLTVARFPLRIDSPSDVYEDDHIAIWLDDTSAIITDHLSTWIADVEATDSSATPWYDCFHNRLLELRPLSTADTFGHPIACILVTSVHHPEPLNALAALYSATSPASFYKDKPFVDPTILRYYVVLHDVRNSDMAESQALFEQVRRAYGVHCAILPFNSFDPDAPAPLEGKKDTRPAAFDMIWPHVTVTGLGEKDVLAVRVFLRDMVVMSLVPWMERNVQQWNETLTAARKSLGGRLFTAGRKYFGGSASGRSSPNLPAPAYDAVKGYYIHQSEQAQTRRLADFALMIRDYKLAASTYDLLRKDLANDRAWRDAAQAARLTGLCYLLQSWISPSMASKRSDANSFLEAADSICASLSSSRAEIVAFDGLKMACLYYTIFQRWSDLKQVPSFFLRTAGDTEEFWAALLLEQAAVAERRSSAKSASRKAAFHLSMAAQRYEKTGFKLLARHCLLQASKNYTALPEVEDIPEKPRDPISTENHWPLIDRYVHQSLARQAYNLGRSDEALEHFIALLQDQAEIADTEEPEGDQDVWADLELALKSGSHDSTFRPSIPLKIFDPQEARILSGHDAADLEDAAWEPIEGEALRQLRLENEAAQIIPHSLLRSIGRDESFQLSASARNRTSAILKLSSLRLEIHDGSDEKLSPDTYTTEAPAELILLPGQTQTIIFNIRCHRETHLSIHAISFTVNDLLTTTDHLARQGKRLHATKQQLLEPHYATDNTFRIIVREPIPSFLIDSSSLPQDLMAGETVPGTIFLRLANAATSARMLLLADSIDTFAFANNEPGLTQEDQVRSISSKLQSFACAWEQCTSNQATVKVCLRGAQTGRSTIKLLVACNKLGNSKYHLIRRTIDVQVAPSLSLFSELRPTQIAESSYTLQLRVENNDCDETVEITSIASFAPLWQTHMASTAESVAIPAGQALELAIGLSPRSLTDPTLCQPGYTTEQLDALIRSDPSLFSTCPCEDIIHFQFCNFPTALQDPLSLDLVLGSKTSIRSASLAAQFPSIVAKLFHNIFRLFTAQSLDLVVCWKTASGRRGWHHLTDISVGPLSSTVEDLLERAEGKAGGIYQESQRERQVLLSSIAASEYAISDNPVWLSLAAPATFERDTSKHFEKVDVHFDLRNLSTTADASYELCLTASDERKGQAAACQWAGLTTFRGSLKPLEQVSVSAQALLSGIQAIDIGRWTCTISAERHHSWTINGSERLVFVTLKA